MNSPFARVIALVVFVDACLVGILIARPLRPDAYWYLGALLLALNGWAALYLPWRKRQIAELMRQPTEPVWAIFEVERTADVVIVNAFLGDQPEHLRQKFKLAVQVEYSNMRPPTEPTRLLLARDAEGRPRLLRDERDGYAVIRERESWELVEV